MDNVETPKGKKKKEILDLGRKRFTLCEEAFSKTRDLSREDLEFRKGEQWPDDVIQSRRFNKRPCLTINKIPQFERQIINDQKQNSPAIKVRPVDDYADLETAKVLQGLIRNIETQSDAEEVYDHAFTCAVRGAFGFLHIYTDYESDKSFNLEAKIGKIDNAFNAYLDPYSHRS